MAKLFGQYLVQRGLITEEELLQVLMEQSSRLPPLHELLYRNRILPAPDLIRAFAHQFEHDTDFKGALKALGLWSTRVHDSVERRTRSLRIPVGQILVRNGRVSFEIMNKALEDFLQENYRNSERNRKDSGVPVEVEFNPAEALDPGLVQKCGELINEILESDLSERISKLAENGVYDESLCDSISIDLHRIRAATRFIGAVVNASFAEVLEKSFKTLTSQDGFSDWTELTNGIVEGLAIIAEYTRDLLATQSETAGYDKFGSIEEVANNLRQLVVTHLEIAREHKDRGTHVEHRHSILYLDSSKSAHRYFLHCLTGHPEYGALSCTSRKELVSKLSTPNVEAIVIEHRLALEHDLLASIEKQKPNVPIILLSGRSSELSLPGIRAVLKKPFFESDLVSVVSEVIRSKKAA